MRYPIADLFNMMGGSTNECLHRLGISGGAYGHMVRFGLSLNQCERFAERAGFHPYEVWPELRDDVIRDVCEPPPVRAVHALVTCLECGRPLTVEHASVDQDGAHGELLAACPVGHWNTMRVEMEVA